MGADLTAPVTLDALAERLLALRDGRRRIVALAGAPGSGKSTAAEALVDRLNAAHPRIAALLPMDGYHFDDTLLRALGRHARKGAPDTFDVGGLAAMLARLRADDEDEIVAPVFDRDIEIARAGARVIPRAARIIVCEGNYLLLDRAPWLRLSPLFDLTVMIEVPEEELRRRLTARWEGYRLPPEEIRRKLDAVDLPNARTVQRESRAADLRLVERD